MYILEFLKWLLLERQVEGRAKSQLFCYESYTCTFLPNCVQVCDNLTPTLHGEKEVRQLKLENFPQLQIPPIFLIKFSWIFCTQFNIFVYVTYKALLYPAHIPIPEYIALSTTVDGRYTVYVVFATLITMRLTQKFTFAKQICPKMVGVNWIHKI